MTARPPWSPESPGTTAHPDRLLAILANEHASLNATRAMAWGDSSSRIGSFLSVLGAGSVAIALVGGATDFAPTSFLPFSALVLAVTLFLGITAYLRLVQINIEDATLMGAMNRVRAGYLAVEPEARRYLSTEGHDDPDAVLRSLSLGLAGPVGGTPVVQALVTAPVAVGVIVAVVAGLLAGCVALLVGWSVELVLLAGAIASILAFAGLVWWMAKAWMHLLSAVAPRFPTSPDGPSG